MFSKPFFSIFSALCCIWLICSSAAVAGQESTLGGLSWPYQQGPEFGPTSLASDYMPGEFTVKLKPGKTLVDIQAINARHQITHIGKAFKETPDRRQRLKGIKNKLAKTLSMRERENLQKQIQPLEKLVTRLERRQKRAPKGAKIPNLSNIYHVTVNKNADIPFIVEDYQRHPAVEYAEPNYMAFDDVTVPNDPLYVDGSLWGLDKINMTQAWDQTTGNMDVIIAPIESGIQISHEDLAGNIWVNEGEIPNNGVDDDNNGFVDDYNGVLISSATEYTTDIPSHYHGTHVAGTIAAVGDNNLGVLGVAWNSKIMPALSGVGRKELAIQYAVDNGADVINNSWYSIGAPSGTNYGQKIKDVIDYAHAQGCVVVASAGNRATETTSQLPAQLENVITVSATDRNDQLWSLSNYGVKVDVAAPGVSIRSTGIDGKYISMSGTSMAAPHVSGLAALMISQNQDLNAIDPLSNPLLTNEEIRQIIRISADDIIDPLGDGGSYPGLDIYTGYGRINAFEALKYTSACEANLIDPYTNTSVTNADVNPTYYNGWTAVSGSIDIRGMARCGAAQLVIYKLEFGRGYGPQTWTLIQDWTLTPPGEISFSGFDTDSLENDVYVIRLTVMNAGNESFEDRLMINVARALITNLPQNDEPFWDQVPLLFEPYDITGYATGTSLASYRLAYEEASNPDVWTVASEDVTTAVENSILFNDFDFTQLPTGRLTLKLQVDDLIAGTSEDTLVIENDSLHFPNQSGFPIPLLSNYSFSSPTIADIELDGQGHKEIIVGADTGGMSYLYAYRSDGTRAFRSTQIGGLLRSSPTVGNLDDDPEMEIGIKYHDTNSHFIDLFNHDGTPLASWTTLSFPMNDYNSLEQRDSHSSLVFYNMDDDVQMEIIFGTSAADGGRVYIYDSNGSSLPGWEGGKVTSAQVLVTPVVGDVDNDGSPEVVALDKNNNIYIWNRAGQLVWEQPENGTWTYISRIALGDLNSDGYLEIIASYNHPTNNGVSIWSYTGSYQAMNHYVKDDFGAAVLAVALGDLDNDGSPEVVLSVEQPYDDSIGSYVYAIHALKLNGDILSNLNGWPVFPDVRTGVVYPVIADVDNDGLKDVLVSSYNKTEINILGYSANGDPLTGDNWPIRKRGRSFSSMAVDDLDNDGDIELIYNGSSREFRVWDLPYAFASGSMEWPMFQHDAQHTGNYNYIAPDPLFISGFWPPTGVTNDIIFVFGSGFDTTLGNTSVTVNGIPAPAMQVSDSTLLLFIVPPGNTSGPIAVTVNGITAVSPTWLNDPTVTASNDPVVSGIWPSQGPVGTLAFVFGSNFVADVIGSRVDVNGVSTQFYQVIDNSLIIFLVPPGATTGPVTVTNPDNRSGSSPIDFRVTQ